MIRRSGKFVGFLLIQILSSALSQSRNTCKGVESFEKVTRMTFGTPIRWDLLLVGEEWHTKLCLDKCKERRNCRGIEINYLRKTCSGFDFQPANRNVTPQHVRKPVNSFQKICLSGVPECTKAWMLERVIGFEIVGFDDLVLKNIRTRLRCAELCLRERNLPCRSAEYNERSEVCRLSRQDRRTQTLNFKPAPKEVHYMENQCNDLKELSYCEYDEYTGQDLGQADLVLSSTSKSQCREACERETLFNCRSYTWMKHTLECHLSSDDEISAGPSSLKIDPLATFYQRAPCLDLQLECTTNSMEVKLNTAEPFTGLMFPQSSARAKCQVHGKGSKTTSLKLMFEDPKCGVVDEGGGVLSNVVVVQHHPVIQRRGDRSIKLVCLFQMGDRTVSNGFNIDYKAVSGAVATAIVNATAPSPKIRLRIVNRKGNDVSGVHLGDELYLRLDLDEASIYGILARNLVAKNGDNSDSIQLLDEKGCPVDPLIFPSLEAVPNSRSLQGKFEAFKFSEDSVVRFQLNVQFCLEQCRPAQCGNVISYGKRKRRNTVVSSQRIKLGNQDVSGENNESSVYHEMPLQREIFVSTSRSTPVHNGRVGDEDVFLLENAVCTSKDLLIAIIVSCMILQICLILVAVMCVAVKIRRLRETSSQASVITVSSGSRRHTPLSFSSPSEHSSNTFKNLRTSLRD